MSESSNAQAWLARARSFALPLLLCAVVALIAHPLALVLMLFAQPLYSAAWAKCLQHLHDEPALVTVLRRCTALFALYVLYTAMVAILVGAPVVALVKQGTPLTAFLLSGGVLLAVMALWRLWPAFTLPLLWDDAFPHAEEGSWIIGTIKRSISFAWHLTGTRDVFFARGLPVALLLLLLVCGALALAGFGSVLPSELRIGALVLFALVLAPFAHWVLIHRTGRLLQAEPVAMNDALHAVSPPVIAPIALAPLPSSEGLSLDAQLYQAVAAHQTDLALSLLEHGADAAAWPGPMDRDQRSLLMIAATHNDVRLLRALIARGAPVNQAVNGLTPLLCATRDSHQGRADAVLTLVTNGAVVNAFDPDGHGALHHAALSADAAVAAALLDAGADLETINREGLTPLGVAAGAGNVVLTKYLLEHKAKVQSERGISALIAACNGVDDHASVVKLLLKAKADLHARDRLGRTALHAAALHGHAESVELLLQAGADANARDAHGVTALMEAARAGSNRVLQRLVFSKPEPGFVDHAGRSALVIASQSRQANRDTVQLLMAMGADPSQAVADGRKAVDFAAAAGRWPMVAVIDPAYPLPVAHEPDEALAARDESKDPPTLRREAARQGRANLLKGLFFEEWTDRHELGDLYVLAARALHGVESTCRVLVQRGAKFDSPCSEGGVVLTQLLKQGQVPLTALRVLMQRGSTPSGGNGLALLLDAAVDTEQQREIEALALQWLEQGADAFGVDARGRSPLQIAVQLGFEHLARELIARGADPNASDARGRGPLHELAVCPEDLAAPLARYLLRAGANPERRAADGHSALGHALAAGRPRLAQALNFGGFVHPGRALQARDLPAAATTGDLAAVQRLLDLQLPIDARDAQGCTALIRAAGGGHLAVLDCLLQRGADLNAAANTGATALSAAITAKREAVVDALLARGADVESVLPGGITPLMIAAALGHLGLLQQLLKHGATVDRADEQGNNALHAAVQFCYQSSDFDRARQLMDALFLANASLHARNAQGQTALLLLLGARAEAATAAPQRRLAELLEILIKRRVELNVQDQRGVSALHACAMHGLTDCARLLLRSGIQVALRDFRGRSALDVAQLLGYNDLVAELKRHGAV